ncbi:MAG: hypothetical protein COA94_02370 [Rickettsiales bacterium]|nr:MAG: hypothetical protein COA94_02370 [Rickettsiales bacterium]
MGDEIPTNPKSPRDETIITIDGKDVDRDGVDKIELIDPLFPNFEEVVDKIEFTEEVPELAVDKEVLDLAVKKIEFVDDTHELPKSLEDMSYEEKLDTKNELLVKIRILRKTYPEYDIPMCSTKCVSEIKKIYDKWLRQAVVEKNAGDYKIYLVLFWLVIELIGTKVLGLNFSGFTLNQFNLVNKYETLLLELGEKSYSDISAEWSPEVRLIFLSMTNAIIFTIFKYISSSLGVETANAIQSAFNGLFTKTKSGKGETDVAGMIANFGSMFTGVSNTKTNTKPSRVPKYSG